MTAKRDKRLEVSVVANRLNVSAPTVYRLIKSGRLRAMRLGASQCVRVLESSVESFELSRVVGRGDDGA